jgi:hypothetical protein
MTTRNRETLRGFFGAGMLPTQDHFGDLIESMLNMDDEGFRKSEKNGVEISTPAGYNALMSFYRDQNKHTALWSVAYGGKSEQLVFNAASVAAAADTPPVLALDARNRVGIGTNDPQQALDVRGMIASDGRIGRAPATQALADGDWHDLTDTLHGCQAFEVMAGAGRPNGGRFALLHATALNTYNPGFGWQDLFAARKRIRQQSMWYGRRCDQLELRWSGTSGRDAGYTLQVRSKCNYGPGIAIRAMLTRLWVDENSPDSAP